MSACISTTNHGPYVREGAEKTPPAHQKGVRRSTGASTNEAHDPQPFCQRPGTQAQLIHDLDQHTTQSIAGLGQCQHKEARMSKDHASQSNFNPIR